MASLNPRVWLRDWLNKPTDAEAEVQLRELARSVFSRAASSGTTVASVLTPNEARDAESAPPDHSTIRKLQEYAWKHGLSDSDLRAICDAGIAATCNLRPDIAERIGGPPETQDEFLDLTPEQALDCLLSSIRSYADLQGLTADELSMIFDAGLGAAHNVREDLKTKIRGRD